MLEQFLRFFDFGEISPRTKSTKTGASTSDTAAARPSLMYRRASPSALRSSKVFVCWLRAISRALLKASSAAETFEGSRRDKKLTTDTMQFGIQPMLAGLLRPSDQLSSKFPAQYRVALPLRSPRQPASPKMVHKGSSHFREVMSSLGSFPPVHPFGRRHATLPGRSGGASGHIQRHRMVAGETSARIVSVCLQHAPA